MPLLARTIHTPITIDIRPGAVGALGTILNDSRISAGGEIAVVVGPGLGGEVADLVRGSVDRASIIAIEAGTLASALELAEKLRGPGYDAVVGIGGGRIIDTVKYAASQVGLPMVSVATSLAHDGLASPVSVLDREGVSISYGVHTPFAVLVDLDFVRRSSRRQIQSGVGDALSNLSAAADWRLANQVTGLPIDGLAIALASTGAQSLLTHLGELTDDDFLTTLANALVLGGVAMAVAGSSLPCSGGCHEIAHAISKLFPGTGTHGQLVAMGALYCTHLRGDLRLFKQLSEAMLRYELPRVPVDLGLSEAQFAQAITLAPRTRPGRYTILEHLAMSPHETVRQVAKFTELVGAQ